MSGATRKPTLTAAIRTALADYMRSEGCSCCEDTDTHKEAGARLAKLLRVPRYKDGSGYDFDRYRTPKEPVR
jgi:hypothetical protein